MIRKNLEVSGTLCTDDLYFCIFIPPKQYPSSFRMQRNSGEGVEREIRSAINTRAECISVRLFDRENNRNKSIKRVRTRLRNGEVVSSLVRWLARTVVATVGRKNWLAQTGQQKRKSLSRFALIQAMSRFSPRGPPLYRRASVSTRSALFDSDLRCDTVYLDNRTAILRQTNPDRDQMQLPAGKGSRPERRDPQ